MFFINNSFFNGLTLRQQLSIFFFKVSTKLRGFSSIDPLNFPLQFLTELRGFLPRQNNWVFFWQSFINNFFIYNFVKDLFIFLFSLLSGLRGFSSIDPTGYSSSVIPQDSKVFSHPATSNYNIYLIEFALKREGNYNIMAIWFLSTSFFASN